MRCIMFIEKVLCPLIMIFNTAEYLYNNVQKISGQLYLVYYEMQLS